MIDTVAEDFLNVVIPQAVLDDRTEEWAYTRTRNKHGGWRIVYTKIVTLANGAIIQYEYYPFAIKDKPYLRVIFSLPKVIFGNNFRMVYDIEGAVEIANKLLPQVHGIPNLDLWKGKLVRLDVCYNHRLGYLIPYVIRAMQYLEHDRRKTLPYSSEGVSYGNGSITTYFYDKAKELRKNKAPKIALEAYGILRQESSYRKAYIKKLTGKEYPTMKAVTSVELLIKALEEDLKELGLLGNSIGTADETFERLLESFDEDTATYLLGLIVRRKQLLTTKNLVASSKKSKTTIRRRIADVLSAHVPLTLASYTESLPALFIDRDMILREEKVQKRMFRNDIGKLPE